MLTPQERTGDFSDLYTGVIDQSGNTGYDTGQLTGSDDGVARSCAGLTCATRYTD